MSSTQNFQKDALFRQMREYKRERNLYEEQVADLTKRAQYHDDHMRIIDIWFTQVCFRYMYRFAPPLR